MEGVTDSGVEYLKIIITEVTQNIIVPYIPRRWASLRLPAPNSEVVRISDATVFSTIEVFFRR